MNCVTSIYPWRFCLSYLVTGKFTFYPSDSITVIFVPGELYQRLEFAVYSCTGYEAQFATFPSISVPRSYKFTIVVLSNLNQFARQNAIHNVHYGSSRSCMQ